MLTPNTVLQGRYQIIRQLGAGGMGAVYLALHLGLNQYVALKENLASDPAANAQFQTEAAILARLSHPNLPRVTDFFIESNGTRYLVMDYIEGQNLEQIIQSGALDEEGARTMMAQIFGAVEYLHANRIIHRDIKPQNIILTPQNKAVLVDFGIAKVYVTGSPTLSGARALGSPGFAPPEQYSGGTDERSDIYALGATLYFALTGRAPEDAPRRAAGISLTPPRQINLAISPITEAVILTAMNLAAPQRFSSVDGMRQALAMTPLPLTRPASSRTKPWLIAIGIAFGIFSLITLAFIVMVLGNLFKSNNPIPTQSAYTTSLSTSTVARTATSTPTAVAATATIMIPTATPNRPTQMLTKVMSSETPTKVVTPEMPANFSDDFSQPRFLPIVETAWCNTAYQDSAYHFWVSDQSVLCKAIYPRTYSNFTSEVGVALENGEGWGGGGADILFGYKDEKTYFSFEVNRTTGEYNISKKENGLWKDIRGWNSGSLVSGPDKNGVSTARLKIVVQGQQASFYSGGTLLVSLQMPDYSGGRVGLAATTWGQTAHVIFSNFKIDSASP